jgi:hypothetical protein
LPDRRKAITQRSAPNARSLKINNIFTAARQGALVNTVRSSTGPPVEPNVPKWYLWGVRSRSLRSDEFVLVDESSEDVVPPEMREGHAGGPVDRAAIRRDETKAAVRSVLVVVTDVEL